MPISSRWEKIPTQRDQKTVVYKCKKKRRYERREKGKTLEEKSEVYIIRYILFILLVS